MKSARFLADRAVVLLLGVAVGVAIGYAFGLTGKSEEQSVSNTTSIAPAITTSTSNEISNTTISGSTVTANETFVPQTGPQKDLVQNEAYKPSIPMQSSLPPAPSGATLAKKLAQGEALRVGVFGDSYGDGLWSALYRLLPAKEGFRVLKFSQQSTGFTRYQSQNVEEKAKSDLATQPIDIAIICFGANDVQGVLVGHHAAPLLSAEWRQVIGDRIENFVAMLKQKGIAVYWGGLPVMRKPAFDADISNMNNFYAAEMAKLNVPFIETRSLTVDGQGQYAPYLLDGAGDGPKKMTLMRANDGVHMSMTGYIRLSRGLASQIKHFADQNRPKSDNEMASQMSPVSSPNNGKESNR
ncbi:MAG: SGNH family hydrolase [Zymomonas mobilis subsp. pomaceae]